MTAVKSVSVPGIECIGGPLDGQRLEFDCPQVRVPIMHSQENLRRWNVHDKQNINPVNCGTGWYLLVDGFYRWEN